MGINTTGFGDVENALSNLQSVGENTPVRYVVGTGVKYSVFVEFGTKSMQAQPYLRPALREAAAQADGLAASSSSTDEFVQKLALLVERKAKGKAPVDTGTLRESIHVEQIE